MINLPKCPKCGSDTAPDLIEINILEDDYCVEWYEELYECHCGCRFVMLHTRKIDNDEKIWIHRVEHEEKK